MGAPAGSSFTLRVRRLDRETALALGALVLVAAAAWAGLIIPSAASEAGSMPGMESGPAMDSDGGAAATSLTVVSAAAFVAAWVVMMSAMMLPSAAPIVVLSHRMAVGSRHTRLVHTSILVVGYLAVWALFGLGVYLLQVALSTGASAAGIPADWWPFLVAGTLVAAGAYQFTPLKDRCLRQCRSPFSFVLTHWRGGLGGSLRLGVDHGIYCVGCCSALMVVLVVAGGMGLAWVALIALVVFAEKLLPRGRLAARAVGILLIALGVGVAAWPGLASGLPM
jgi:predicted metal-binding membrane protein